MDTMVKFTVILATVTIVFALGFMIWIIFHEIPNPCIRRSEKVTWVYTGKFLYPIHKCVERKYSE